MHTCIHTHTHTLYRFINKQTDRQTTDRQTEIPAEESQHAHHDYEQDQLDTLEGHIEVAGRLAVLQA